MQKSVAHIGGRIVAIIVTFNRLEHIKKTVISCLAEPLDRLLIVDNGSTDGTREWLAQQKDPRICVIENSENLGGAGGFELGMRRAMAQEAPDWLLLMDDDARPCPGAITAFRENQSPGVDVIAARVMRPDGRICEMNRPSRNPFWSFSAFLKTLFGGGRMGFHIKDVQYDGTQLVRIDAASFVGLFVSRQAVAKTGYPEGQLFLYGDDVLYTLALRRQGLCAAFDPNITFEHSCSAITDAGGGAKCYDPIWKVYYTCRNGLLLYRSVGGQILFWPVAAIVMVKWLRAGKAYGAAQFTYNRILRLAIFDALCGRRYRPHHQVLAFVSRADSLH